MNQPEFVKRYVLHNINPKYYRECSTLYKTDYVNTLIEEACEVYKQTLQYFESDVCCMPCCEEYLKEQQ